MAVVIAIFVLRHIATRFLTFRPEKEVVHAFTEQQD